MTDNVIELGGITYLDVPVERVCDSAKQRLHGGGVVVIGWDEEGGFYFASSIADGGEVIWLMEKAKLALFEVDTVND
ncbi:MAG: hypothetical protein KAI73_01110 [Rhodospirillaceae bacterium]|nr:hypothetical protein [Rhodospirillaceae bacterium]